ncbi:hypothetical protein F5Y17DRAFT_470324 [Xylariaceae sp. FL0594]|nr:hypothetical protein F5Y17DRAFT_470324 [Xylariaceae sp. FL0594]
MPSSQRPFSLFSLISAFRGPAQQTPPPLSASSQPNKHTTTPGSASYSSSSSGSGSGNSSSSNNSSSSPTTTTNTTNATTTTSSRTTNTTTTNTAGAGSVMNQLPLHSPRPIPGAAATTGRSNAGNRHRHGNNSSISSIGGGGRPGHRRGSDSSSEGFRDVLGADKWYIGGRTAAGDEKFFKLGVVKRVRSQDRLSLDRLSL